MTINYIQKINAKVLVNSAAQLKGWEPGAEWEGKGWRWGHVDSETLRAKRQRSVGEDDEERASLGKKTDLGSRFKRWTILQAFSFVTLKAYINKLEGRLRPESIQQRLLTSERGSKSW